MQSPKIGTYSPSHQVSRFEFYILSKGLNSGKPLTTPCPNSFVCICQNDEEKDFYFWLFFGLWKAKHFQQFLCGSVIPFIRLHELKKEITTQAQQVGKCHQAYTKTIEQVKQLEQKEKVILQNLTAINHLKRAMILQHFKG